MRIVPSLLVALFLLSLPFGLADVYAQTTTTIITNVSAQFPDHAVTGGTVQVNVTVIYSGASIGQVMIVLIADISNPLIAAKCPRRGGFLTRRLRANSSVCKKFYLRHHTPPKFRY